MPQNGIVLAVRPGFGAFFVRGAIMHLDAPSTIPTTDAERLREYLPE